MWHSGELSQLSLLLSALIHICGRCHSVPQHRPGPLCFFCSIFLWWWFQRFSVSTDEWEHWSLVQMRDKGRTSVPSMSSTHVLFRLHPEMIEWVISVFELLSYSAYSLGWIFWILHSHSSDKFVHSFITSGRFIHTSHHATSHTSLQSSTLSLSVLLRQQLCVCAVSGLDSLIWSGLGTLSDQPRSLCT